MRRRPIGQILVEKNEISEAELAAALAEQERTGRRLGEILIETGRISWLALARAIAEQVLDIEAPPLEPRRRPPSAGRAAGSRPVVRHAPPPRPLRTPLVGAAAVPAPRAAPASAASAPASRPEPAPALRLSPCTEPPAPPPAPHRQPPHAPRPAAAPELDPRPGDQAPQRRGAAEGTPARVHRARDDDRDAADEGRPARRDHRGARPRARPGCASCAPAERCG